MFGTGPAAEVGAGAVQKAEEGLGVVVAIGEVFELGYAAEGDAEFGTDAQPVNIAGVEAGDKAGPGDVAVPAPRSVAELGLVVSGYEPYYKHLTEAVVAWDSGASFGFEFEPKVVLVFVAASEADYMMAPCENTLGAPFEVLAGAHLEPTVVQPELLDNPETAELDLFAGHMFGE